jgi:hypothetical protein
MSQLKILFPPEAAEEYWGRSKEKTQPGHFDPFALAKVHTPGRFGIRQPNAVYIPELLSSYKAQEKPPPPMPEADENYFVKIFSDGDDSAIEGLCKACGRFNWPNLFARHFDSRNYSSRKPNQESILEEFRNNKPRRPYIMEFGDWWPNSQRSPYMLTAFGWAVHCQNKCSLCELISKSAAVLLNELGPDLMPKMEHILGFWFSDGLNISTEESMNGSKEGKFILTFELFDDGISPLRSLTQWGQDHDKGLAVRSIPETQINITTVKSWLSECSQTHHNCVRRGRRIAQKSYRLRLVDVINNEVIRPWRACRYVALSYVWGDKKQYRAQRADLVCCDKTHDCGSMGRPIIPIDRSKISRTVRDAMDLVEAVGERYLWVDTLCIIQDDEKELNITLKSMAKIYENAQFTIVAADGTNADAGLPGVRPQSRSLTNITGIVDGIPLIHQRSRLQLESTPWARRAWTFQEALFSLKWLIFAKGCVYYGCSTGVFPEHKPDILGAENGGYKTALSIDYRLLKDSNVSKLWADYRRKVGLYTKRQLTFHKDILAAFEGIMGLYEEQTGARFCWGLPTISNELFALSLLWGPAKTGDAWYSLKRRSAEVSKTGSHTNFPSWSWSGWTGGPIEWEWPGNEDNSHEHIRSEVDWQWTDCSSTSYAELSYQTGVLCFITKVAILRPEDLESNCPIYLDDGNVWATGGKCCVLLASVQRFLSTVFLLIAKEEHGTYFRQGICRVPIERWQQIEAESIEIRLG